MKVIRFITVLLVSLGCIVLIFWKTMEPGFTLSQFVVKSVPTETVSQNFDFGNHFRDLGVEGSILIEELTQGDVFQYNPQRNTKAFPVASTFKILNSLIALETGVITDEIAVLTWDGVEREIPAWNRDLNMREAIKLSAVWFYQVLARRVGFDRMQQWLIKTDYGNHTIGSKETIDQFWLNGELQITPQQQVDFLHRLYENNLPFSQRSLAIVKDILITEKTPNYTLRSKTGWFGFGDETKPNIGWYVGYLETGEKVYLFATNIDIHQPQDATARIELTRRCFKQIGSNIL